MATPEGKVKEGVRGVLKPAGAYWHMPVQNGMGKPALDFHNCIPVIITQEMVGARVGLYVGIETKAEGGRPTARQLQTMAEIVKAGGSVFLIDGDLSELKEWIIRPKLSTFPTFLFPYLK